VARKDHGIKCKLQDKSKEKERRKQRQLPRRRRFLTIQ